MNSLTSNASEKLLATVFAYNNIIDGVQAKLPRAVLKVFVL